MQLPHATALIAVLMIVALSAGYAAAEKAAALEKDASTPHQSREVQYPQVLDNSLALSSTQAEIASSAITSRPPK